jgi:hypothetical protein
MAVGFPVIRSIASASVEPLCVQGSGTYLWSMEEWNRRVFRDGGLGVLTCKPFFHIVAFLFVGLKRALLLAGSGMCRYPLGSPVSSYFGVIRLWNIGDVCNVPYCSELSLFFMFEQNYIV